MTYTTERTYVNVPSGVIVCWRSRIATLPNLEAAVWVDPGMENCELMKRVLRQATRYALERIAYPGPRPGGLIAIGPKAERFLIDKFVDCFGRRK